MVFDTLINLYEAILDTAFLLLCIQREDYKPHFVIYSILYGLAQFIFMQYINSFSVTEAILYILFVLLSFLYLRLMSYRSLEDCIVLCSLPQLMIAVINTCMNLVLQRIVFPGASYAEYMETHAVPVVLCVQILHTIAFAGCAFFLRSRKLHLNLTESILTLISLNLCNYMTVCIDSILLADEQSGYYLAAGVLIAIVLAVFVAWMMIRINAKNEILLKEQYEMTLLENSRAAAEETLKTRNELYAIRHDLKHLINTLSKKGEKEKSEQIQAVISEYEQKIGNLILPIRSADESIDCILNIKRQEAVNNGINMRCILQYEHVSEIEKSDLYLILSNLLDNAIRHIGMRKEIEVVIRETPYLFQIVIHNSADRKVINEKGEFIGLQPTMEHGFGIATVMKLVGQYGGDITFDQHDGVFTVQIVFFKRYQ